MFSLNIGRFAISCVLTFIFYCIFARKDVIWLIQWIRRGIHRIRSISLEEVMEKVIYPMADVAAFMFLLFNVIMDSVFKVMDMTLMPLKIIYRYLVKERIEEVVK